VNSALYVAVREDYYRENVYGTFDTLNNAISYCKMNIKMNDAPDKVLIIKCELNKFNTTEEVVAEIDYRHNRGEVNYLTEER
jgi:hypothetical protein